MARKDGPQPPRPPEFGRSFDPARYQLVGIALLSALIVAAVAGAFGIATGHAIDRSVGLTLVVDYPERWRSKDVYTIEVDVTNTSGRDLPRIDVAFDRRYFHAYAATRFVPRVAYVTAEAYVVELHDVRAGETRLVTTEVKADALWLQDGDVVASGVDASARVRLRSFVFP